MFPVRLELTDYLGLHSGVFGTAGTDYLDLHSGFSAVVSGTAGTDQRYYSKCSVSELTDYLGLHSGVSGTAGTD